MSFIALRLRACWRQHCPKRCRLAYYHSSILNTSGQNNPDRLHVVARQRRGESRVQDYTFIRDGDFKHDDASNKDSIIRDKGGAHEEKEEPSRIVKIYPDYSDRGLHGIADKVRHFTDASISYFLPKGYPASVRPGYVMYVRGQMLSMMLSTAGGVLSMQALLHAVGLGAGAIPLAATLNWVIKDGLGQLGGVIFASFVSNRFDADPKRWRMASTLAMDSASFIELLTPLAPQYFLLLASIANIGKNISFLAASASRAAIHKSFAIQENLADLTAKTGSQSIVSSLLGTSLGVSVAALIGDQFHCTVAAYCVCSTVSIAVTYRSLTHVTITSLSLQRLDFMLHDYFEQLRAQALSDLRSQSSHSHSSHNHSSSNSEYAKDEHQYPPAPTKSLIHSEVTSVSSAPPAPEAAALQWLTPDDLRRTERWLGIPPAPAPIPAHAHAHGSHGADHFHPHQLPGLFIGSDLSDVVATQEEYTQMLDRFEGENFVINVVSMELEFVGLDPQYHRSDFNESKEKCDGGSSRGSSRSSSGGAHRGIGKVHLLYKEDASEADMLRGLFHAHIVRLLMLGDGYTCAESEDPVALHRLQHTPHRWITWQQPPDQQPSLGDDSVRNGSTSSREWQQRLDFLDEMLRMVSQQRKLNLIRSLRVDLLLRLTTLVSI